MSEEALPVVMVVEDDPAFIYLMQRFVIRSGCRLVSTTQGEEALALARRERPSVIVLDVGLPGMSGWEVLEVLKADQDTRGIPVVVCSGWDAEIRSREKGVAGYLNKPVRYNDFVEALASVGITPRTSLSSRVGGEERERTKTWRESRP